MQNLTGKNLELHCSRNQIVDTLYHKLSDELRNNLFPGSPMTTLRKLSAQYHVAPQTVKKVYERLENDGYIYRAPGRKIYVVTGNNEQKHCIGVVMPFSLLRYIQPGTDRGNLRLRLYCGITERAAELGFSVLPIFLPPPDSRDSDVEAAILRIRRKCAGIVHLGDRGVLQDFPLTTLLQCKDIPQVAFKCSFPGYSHIGKVTIDTEKMVYDFVNYIHEFDLKRIAIVLPAIGSEESFAEYTLLKKEQWEPLFKNAGVDPQKVDYLFLDKSDSNQIWGSVQSLFSAPNPPDIFWCRDDEFALKLLRVLKEHNIYVPQQVSVMGFDNSEKAELSQPPLTTIDNPYYKMGCSIVEMVYDFIKNGINERNKLIEVGAFLVQRKSVGQFA